MFNLAAQSQNNDESVNLREIRCIRPFIERILVTYHRDDEESMREGPSKTYIFIISLKKKQVKRKTVRLNFQNSTPNSLQSLNKIFQTLKNLGKSTPAMTVTTLREIRVR